MKTTYQVAVFAGSKAGTIRMFEDRKAAYRYADRLDNAYGAICSTVQPITCAVSQ